MKPVPALLLAVLLVAPLTASAAPNGLFGDWKTPDGSVVRTFPCANELCMKIVTITPTSPGTVDHNNPDATLRARSLCNLQIGSGFAIAGDTTATSGQLYDPESGKSYKGDIDLKGDVLKLRGYIGIALFGRTEIWHRTSDVTTCSK